MIGFAVSEDQVAAQKWAHEFAEKEIGRSPHYDETEDLAGRVQGGRHRPVRHGLLPDDRR